MTWYVNCLITNDENCQILYAYITYGLVNHTRLSSETVSRRGKMYRLNSLFQFVFLVDYPLPLSQVIGCFGFFRYIAFAMHLDICCVNLGVSSCSGSWKEAKSIRPER
jgi:hypothetical protein